MNDKNKKSAWDDLSSSWKKLAAIIGAISVASAFIVELFNLPREKVLPPLAFFGVIVIVLAWYVDKQAFYTKRELDEHKKESNELVGEINDTMKSIKKTVDDTRKDTLRIQLLMYIQTDPNNIDTILRLAETYFVELGGDWYMTSEFTKWAKAHSVDIPMNITTIIHKEQSSD